MQTITTIGLDIAESVFQVRGVDAGGQVIIRRQLKRRSVLAFLCFNDGCVSTMAASAVLFLFSVIEKKPPRASPTQEFSHRLYYRVQLVDEHAHVFAIVDGRHDQMHAALLECGFQHRREFPCVADAGAFGAI